MFNKEKITNAWFITNAHPALRFLGIYINGDMLVLFPLIIVIIIISIFSLKIGLILAGIYHAIRGLGEMIYWLLHQFGNKTYRPYDYGLVNISNESIYILYQLTSMVNLIIGAGIIVISWIKL